MNISITPELEALINKKVKTGLYHSASEVVREGLRLLKERDELRELRIKELKREIQDGYDSSAREEWSLDRLKKKVRSRVKNAKNNS